MSLVESSLSGDVLTITFNRPEVHNAFNDVFGDEFQEILQDARRRDDAKVVVLRGAGKSFCSGRDFREMGERPPGVSHHEYMVAGQQKIKILLEMGKPIIAALKGAVYGGGCEYALVADNRIAAPTTRIAMPEINYGLAVDQGGSALAASLIGPSRTKWMLLTGEPVDAQTALDWGLVDFVVPLEELDAHVEALARKIAAKPWRAVLAAKGLVDELWADGVRAAIRRELQQQLALFASEDFEALRERRRAEKAARSAAALPSPAGASS
jgi:enoyl-CoA hydratase